VLGSAFFKKVKHVEKEAWLVRVFENVIRVSLRNKGWVIAGAIVLLIGSLSLIPRLGVSFLPAGTQPNLEVELTLPFGTTVNEHLRPTEAGSYVLDS
jgi:multidrug efflux pump subunit AcrB